MINEENSSTRPFAITKRQETETGPKPHCMLLLLLSVEETVDSLTFFHLHLMLQSLLVEALTPTVPLTLSYPWKKLTAAKKSSARKLIRDKA